MYNPSRVRPIAISMSKAKSEASSEARERQKEVGLVREASSEASCFM